MRPTSCATGAPVVLAGDINVVPTGSRHLSDEVLGPRRLAAAREPRRLSAPPVARVDRRRPRAPSRRSRCTRSGTISGTRWERDAGLRLDHILLSPALTERLQDVGVDRETRGKEGASDHAPVWIETSRSDTARRPLLERRDRRRRAALSSQSERATRPAGRKTGRPGLSRAASAAKPKVSGAPLLVDRRRLRSPIGRTTHCRRPSGASDGKGAGAILGFANVLLRFYDAERPRAIVVGWDSLESPTRRHELFPAYQSGREFDDDLIEQLERAAGIGRGVRLRQRQGPGVRGG